MDNSYGTSYTKLWISKAGRTGGAPLPCVKMTICWSDCRVTNTWPAAIASPIFYRQLAIKYQHNRHGPRHLPRESPQKGLTQRTIKNQHTTIFDRKHTKTNHTNKNITKRDPSKHPLKSIPNCINKLITYPQASSDNGPPKPPNIANILPETKQRIRNILPNVWFAVFLHTIV